MSGAHQSVTGADARYIEGLWRRYLDKPDSVPADWRNAFAFVLHFYGPMPSADAEHGAYLRRFGHLHADLDPLERSIPDALPPTLQAHPLAGAVTGPLAIEAGHLDDRDQVAWIDAALDRIAASQAMPSRDTYRLLLRSEIFEQTLAAKFTAKKRFGSEGADAIVPLVSAICREAQAVGIDHVVVGSMHRGRLTLMTNVFGMPAAELFARMRGRHPFPGAMHLPADVPYHFGCEGLTEGVAITLLPNPSHLEAINPVAIGYARGRQRRAENVLALILHTDASVVAQGVNAELIQMAGLNGYTVGGAVHVVINNQIGFTTDPSDARTARYCTSGWRAADSLILHVNGHHVDSTIQAGRLAVEYRQAFARDAVIDLVCYRANGHNEIDEPRFTQPDYYRRADALPSVTELYETRLIELAMIDKAEIADLRQSLRAKFDAAYAASDTTNLAAPSASPRRQPLNALNAETLRALGTELSTIPADVAAHPKMRKLMAARRDELDNGISWPFAEALALASVAGQGVPVRFSGQDIERGSFSQRHFAAVDPASGAKQSMLDRFARDGASIDIINSPLSEYAVLGFEYGHSLAAPETLTIWEAQFGDFANGAQIVIDQFIVSAREKWGLESNLVILLPHGLEGQGPEHSSARIERVLQLCARNNLVVAQPSTPSNYFHLLRRQPSENRPLVVLTPKMLLRLPEARSPLADFVDGASFQPVIAAHRSRGKPTRTVICSGKIAYELEKARTEAGADLSIIRLEQFYPFPGQELATVLAGLDDGDLVWLQEEPVNFGAWQWLAPRLTDLAGRAWQVSVVARAESASPAGSFHDHHARDQHDLIQRALKSG